MLRIVLVVVYTGMLAGANAAHADVAAAQAVLGGDMRKLQFHAEAKAVPEVALTDLADGERRLSEWQGKWVVLNFWATWCAPCRKEMPQLNELSGLLADKGAVVVTVATGRNPPEAIERFFEQIGGTDMPALRDPKSELARGMAVLGLPVTVILNPEGAEVARLIGDADWASADAQAVMAALMAP